MQIEKLLLHVGYPKAGSTWLQRVIFDSGKYGFVPWAEDGSEQRARILWDADRLDYDAAELRARYLAKLRRDLPRDRWLALSSEAFVGNPMSGGFNALWNAEALAQMFPQARVLMVVREQRSMALSCYAQYVKEGGLLSLERFLVGQKTGKMPTFDLRFFEYHKLVAAYRRLFGENRVLVLPFELLRASPMEYVQRLRSFCGLAGAFQPPPGTPLNRANSALALCLMRPLNPLRVGDPLNGFSPWASRRGRKIVDALCRAAGHEAFGGISARITRRWQEVVETLLAGRFAASNAALAHITGLPLGQYGYELSGDLQPVQSCDRRTATTHDLLAAAPGNGSAR